MKIAAISISKMFNQIFDKLESLPTTTLNLRSIGIGLSFGFCQILGRYTMSLGWSKYWGVLGVLPVTNIVLFLILIFFKKR